MGIPKARLLNVFVLCYFYYLFIYLFVFSAPHPMTYGGSQARGRIRATPQPQQRGIQAESATYTTAHSNAGSLTHWERQEIKPVSSWMLTGFVSTEPCWELPFLFLKLSIQNLIFKYLMIWKKHIKWKKAKYKIIYTMWYKKNLWD